MCRHGGDEDTGGDSNGGGTDNTKQSNKSSNKNGDRNGEDDSNNETKATAVAVAAAAEAWRQRGGGGQLGGNGGSLARACCWWRQQRGGHVGSGKMDKVLFKALRLYLRRPHTDRISEGVPKKLRRNRNRDSCEKSATGTENTGIWRIPAGITNLASLR